MSVPFLLLLRIVPLPRPPFSDMYELISSLRGWHRTSRGHVGVIPDRWQVRGNFSFRYGFTRRVRNRGLHCSIRYGGYGCLNSSSSDPSSDLSRGHLGSRCGDGTIFGLQDDLIYF